MSQEPDDRHRASLRDRLSFRVGARIPEDSVLYGKVLPAVIVALGLMTIVLIVAALSVLLIFAA